MATVYARMPDDIRKRVTEYGEAKALNQSEALTELVQKGLGVAALEEQLNQTRTRAEKCEEEAGRLRTQAAQMQGEQDLARRRLSDAERAKAQLDGILSVPVGKCTVAVCKSEVSLRDFAFQRCPRGHMNSTELYPQYRKIPTIGDVVVPSLAVIGVIALASELLGGQAQK